MLLKDFYTINKLENISEGKYQALISLNPKHEIFKGHFPGNPVTPGVCMMQIIKELTQEIVGEKLFMKASSNVKFMALINPEVTPDLKLDLEISGGIETEIKVKNASSFNDTIALKLTNTYVKA